MARDEEEEPPADLPPRRFGWSNMFVAPEKDPRSQTPSVGERAALVDFLRGYRQTLELKCQGLTADQLARHSVPPSNLSLLGLIRHMADVERYWFRQVLSGLDVPRRYRTSDDYDADFNGARADPDVVEEAWTAWRDEITYAERCAQGFEDLGLTVPTPRGTEVAVREVLIHMIEEYARHCGHADLLRERIDGRVGQ
ncbi:MAG TPA: DinB family protein [Acidimicrobiales bacterium]|nr:DinB family protein [Acidimicrobiales bacterium]